MKTLRSLSLALAICLFFPLIEWPTYCFRPSSSCCQPSAAHAQGWTNPMVLPGLENRSLGDPYMMKYRGYYYLYVSAGDRNIYCWRTKDLMEWSEPFICCTDETTAVAYAPEVIYWNGLFYMCTSPRGGGHYLLTSQSPTGPFTHQTGNLGRDIDGSMFVNDDGKWYFYHANYGGIRGCLMPTHLSFGDDVDLGCRISGQWTEGPCVFKRNNLFYLIYTGNHVWTNGYRIDYAISSSGPLSGFRPQSEQNPILVDTETPTHKALGHGTAFVGPDLDTYFFCYHNLQDNKARRLLNFERIAWNGDKLMMTGPTDWEQDRPLVAENDYFERDELGDRWEVTGRGWQTDAQEQALTFFPLTEENPYPASEGQEEADTCFAIFQTEAFADYTAEFSIACPVPSQGGEMGAVFSYVDEANYSLAVINAETNKFEIITIAAGEEASKRRFSLPADFDPACWHSVRIEKKGTRVRAYIDGMRKSQFTLAADAGRIGYASLGRPARFGYVAVSPYVDGSASLKVSQPLPGMIAANLCVEKNEMVTAVSASLSVGKYSLMRLDEGAKLTYNVNIRHSGLYNIGLRYRSTVPSTARLLLDGSVLLDDIELPGTRSTLQVLTLKDLDLPEGHHRLSLELTSGRAFVMEYNIKRGVKNPHPMADNFTDGFSSEWGYREGNWNIEDGQLESTGRYGKMLMGGFDDIHLTDYTVECDVIYSNGQTNGGLLFRTTNASTGGADDNPVLGTDFLQGYVFLASGSSSTLGKHNFGWQALSTVNHAIDISKPHHMKVEVEGATIRCFLDDMDEPLITYTDPVPFITGRAGFRAHDSVLRFDNFVVTPKGSDPTTITLPRRGGGEDAPVRYYNLAGQPISFDALQHQGIYIRSQGSSSQVVVSPIK